MPLFRKKPVTIEAFRLGQKGQPTPAPAWFGSPDPDSITENGIIVHTAIGGVLARWGDWIIRRDGFLSTCADDVFRRTYEPD